MKYASYVLHQNLVHSNVSLYQKRPRCYTMLAFASRYGKLFVYEFRLINSTCDMTWNSIGYTQLNKMNE